MICLNTLTSNLAERLVFGSRISSSLPKIQTVSLFPFILHISNDIDDNNHVHNDDNHDVSHYKYMDLQ